MKARKIMALVLVILVFSAASATAGTLWGTYSGYAKINVAVNGEEKVFKNGEVPAISFEGTTMMPVRAMAQSFGVLTKWDEANQTVNFYKPNVNLTIVEDITIDKKNDLYKFGYPFGKVKKNSKLDFSVLVAVDNLKTEISSLMLSIHSPSGEVVASNEEPFDAYLESFWLPMRMKNVSFDEEGSYSVKLSLKLTDSSSYVAVAEAPIISEGKK